jgi:quercetin dioxygenase-like cupin family protein
MHNVKKLADRLTEPWKPVVVGEANGYLMKVVRIEGTFPWHVHDGQDELFYCLRGTFTVEQEWSPTAVLTEGDVLTVPSGRRHRPIADEPAVAILFERADTQQYGG